MSEFFQLLNVLDWTFLQIECAYIKILKSHEESMESVEHFLLCGDRTRFVRFADREQFLSTFYES